MPKKSARAKPAAAGKKSSGLLVSAVPDSQHVKIRIEGTHEVKFTLPNSIKLSDGVTRVLATAGQHIWLPTQHKQRFQQASWIVNTMADADEYSENIAFLEDTLKSAPGKVVNHPTGILRTRRDRAPEMLEGIEGLQVPKCVRFHPSSPEDFQTVFKREGFKYPVMIRPSRSQAGLGLARIDSASEWEKIYQVPWIGTPMFMTQWVDYSNEDGAFLKTRIVVAGENIFVRHILQSDDWLIHAMERDQAICDWEHERMAELRDNPVVHAIGHAARERLGLDYFGIDVGVVSPDKFVLFEANAAMSILSTYMLPIYRRPEYLKILKDIESGVISMLAAKGVPINSAAASLA